MTANQADLSETEGWIGRSTQRKEDPPLLSGAARFMDDLAPVDGIRYAAILRSPHAHAEILSIDLSAARALEGVIGIVTGRDIAEMSAPVANLFELDAPYYPCALDRVRYVGEPVAVVVARDRYLAEDALDLISVEYRTLPPVIDPEKAASADSVILHDGVGTNIVHSKDFVYGEPDALLAKAAHVIRVKTHYPRVASTPMETFGVIAHFEKAPDRYTVWSNFQGPYTMYPVMCATLRVTSKGLRLISPRFSGGSFGIKQAIYPYIILMCLVSRKFGMPVKWTEDRLEHLAASSCSSDRVVEMTGGFSKDGKLEALKVTQLDNAGAYLRPPEPAGLYRFHATLAGPYECKHFAVTNRVVLTNQMPTGLNRGYGGPQYCFPLERLMHRAGVVLGLDQQEIRRRNFIQRDQFPYTTVSGGVIDSGDYASGLDLALQKAGLQTISAMRSQSAKRGKKFGVGIGCSIEAAGSNLAYINLALDPRSRSQRLPKSGGSSTASVTIDAFGGVTARVDGAPAGQGHETVVAQVVAQEIGVAPDDITVVTELDTLRDPWSVSSGSYANRFSTTVVSAMGEASKRVAKKLRQIAAPALGVDADKVELRDGLAYAVGGRNKPLSIKRLAAMSHWHTGGLPEGMSAGVSEQATLSHPADDVDDEERLRAHITYGFQCDVAAVEIDENTGKVEILNYVSIHDAGTLLNPKLADGQIMGGFAHGLGAALSECVTYSPEGALLTSTFQDYMCTSAVDMPPLVVAHMSSPSPFTLYGSKGLGDGCAMLTPAVIANAIEDATGIEDLSPPFSPSIVWSLLNPQKAGESELDKPADRSTGGGAVVEGEGSAILATSPENVWRILFDVDFMRRVIPGCKSLRQISPEHFEATVVVSVAGIGGEYKADIQLSDKVEGERATLLCEVSGKLGFGSGRVQMNLSRLAAETQIDYRYKGSVGGKAAAIGHRMLGGVMRLLISEFFASINDQLVEKSLSRKLRRIFRRLFAPISLLVKR